MVRSTKPDDADDPGTATESTVGDVEPPAAAGNATPPPRPKPSVEELERLRRKLIAKFH